MKPTLLLLAAGMGSRYGGLKQLDGLGPNGETIMDYSIYDAIQAGFGRLFWLSARISRISSARKSSLSTRVISRQSFASRHWTYLPEGFSVPEGREKPWGTNHAVLMAKDIIRSHSALSTAMTSTTVTASWLSVSSSLELPEGSTNSMLW